MPFGQGRTPLELGAGVLGEKLPKLDDGVPKLDDELPKLGEGVPKLGEGVLKLGDGVPKLGDGVLKLGEGVLKLGDGLLKLGDGLLKLGDDEPGSGASGVVVPKPGLGLSRESGVGLRPRVGLVAVAPPLLNVPEVWAKTAALERTPSAMAAARRKGVAASMLESPLV